MSITFHIAGRPTIVSPDFALNVSNANAHAFLIWRGVPNHEPVGGIGARDLAALLRRRLWPENRRHGDEGLPATIFVGARGATAVGCGRRAGAFARYTEELLRITDHAGDGEIIWG